MTRKLFCVSIEVLKRLTNGAVTAEDLDKGLFYFFDAHRAIVYNPRWASSWELIGRYFTEPTASKLAAHKILVAALDKAEREGRVLWVEPGEPHSFVDVNTLLGNIGYPPIAGYDGREREPGCTPAGIHDRLVERHISVEVVTDAFHHPLWPPKP